MDARGRLEVRPAAARRLDVTRNDRRPRRAQRSCRPGRAPFHISAYVHSLSLFHQLPHPVLGFCLALAPLWYLLLCVSAFVYLFYLRSLQSRASFFLPFQALLASRCSQSEVTDRCDGHPGVAEPRHRWPGLLRARPVVVLGPAQRGHPPDAIEPVIRICLGVQRLAQTQNRPWSGESEVR